MRNMSSNEISSTSSYVLLELEILPESYDFNNEPIVYKNGGRQTKVINGSEEITLQFKLTNKGTGIANDIKYNIVPESKLNGQKISNLFIPKFIGDPKSLDPGKSSYFSVTLKAAPNLKPSFTTFSLSVDDRTKSGTKLVSRPFETDELKRPDIKLLTSVIETAKDPNFSSEVDSRVEANDFIKLKVTIENKGDGPAKNLNVDFLQSQYYQRFNPFHIIIQATVLIY